MCKFEAGFVGCGNMGFALASAAARKVTGEKIILSCKTAEHAKEKAEKLGAAYGRARKRRQGTHALSSSALSRGTFTRCRKGEPGS